MNKPSAAWPRRGSHKRRNIAFLLAGALVIIVIIAGIAGSAQPKSGKTSLVDSVTVAQDACDARFPASGAVYVRTIAPGAEPQARELGGGWHWDRATGRCLTAVGFVIATAPRGIGHCTQVGYVGENAHYDLKTHPAPPLTHVSAHAGPACTARPPAAPTVTAAPPAAPASAAPPAATSAAATTPPAPPPAPTTAAAPTAAPPSTSAPAPTTPAGCYPLSNEGTCYYAGEFCRDDDHGMSGVAGNGEPIICEDNDGWRWEPA